MITTVDAVNKILSVIPEGDITRTMNQSGLVPNSIYDWQRGRKCAKLDNLVAFANAAGVEIVLVKKKNIETIQEYVL